MQWARAAHSIAMAISAEELAPIVNRILKINSLFGPRDNQAETGARPLRGDLNQGRFSQFETLVRTLTQPLASPCGQNKAESRNHQ